jgi:NADH-quinone oxidoreductase subunit L
MSELRNYLILIPLLPLAAAALIAFLGPRLLRNHSHWPAILAVAGSCVLSFLVLFAVLGAGGHTEGAEVDHPPKPLALESYYTWFQTGGLDVAFSLRADALTAIMLVTVTFIGGLITIYSVGYMHDDPGYPRFFAAVALFICAMTILVLANNLLVLYAGWEGVGLCSYLLIGFWFQKPSAAAAARKAFLVTRLGDTGMMLGILMLWAISGSIDYKEVFYSKTLLESPWLTTACLLLFCGAVGKSAQFPLHVWLPDAMEGPTPVSALIHAATMVTAGVYLVARCTPLFEAAESAQLIVAAIGGFTALLAALIALTQNDLKRVLAYSTVSQLGYMFLALGSGVKDLATVAVVAAIFHLFTHAFFKALLFLSAGSVMHAMGGVIDMRRFGGLRKLLPATHWTFLCGALALSGFPLFSGFWSKDEILGIAYEAGGHSTRYGWIYLILFLAGLVTAGLTAFYTFRAYFLTFWGEEKVPHEAGHHAHESPPVMTVPLMILAVFAAGIGLVVGPTHLFAHVLALTPELTGKPAHAIDFLLMAASIVFAVGGIAVAWLMYIKQPGLAAQVTGKVQALYQMSLNKFGFDELYELLILKPLAGLTAFSKAFDTYVVDSLVDLVGQLPRLLATLFRPVQNGLVQFYALATILGLTVFLIALVRSL